MSQGIDTVIKTAIHSILRTSQKSTFMLSTSGSLRKPKKLIYGFLLAVLHESYNNSKELPYNGISYENSPHG